MMNQERRETCDEMNNNKKKLDFLMNSQKKSKNKRRNTHLRKIASQCTNLLRKIKDKIMRLTFYLMRKGDSGTR